MTSLTRRNGVLALVAVPLAVGALRTADSGQDVPRSAQLTPALDWNRATPYPDRVILTWAADPATSQSITWRTDTTVRSARVQFALASPGPGFGHEAKTVDAESQTLDARHVTSSGIVARYHSATLTGLVSDTVYAYRVGDGVTWTEWFHFHTAAKTRKPFSFIYVGDAQNDILQYWSRTIRRSYAEAPDARFIMHAGDLVTDGHSDLQWGEWFRAAGWIHAMVPSVPAPGNHEYRPYASEEDTDDPAVDKLAVTWRPQFTLPTNGVKGLEETNYAIDYQGVRVIALNSSRSKAEQAVWLDSVLKNNPNPWTVLTFHHPIYSTAKERDNPELRALWKPVFDKHAVDLVLQGHDHSYARGRTAVAAANVAAGVNIRDATGPVYTVSVSGPKQYELTKNIWQNYDAMLDRRGENTQLYQVIRVDGDTLRYRSYTAMGTLYDAFDLVHRVGKPNQFVEKMPGIAATRSFADGPLYPYTK